MDFKSFEEINQLEGKSFLYPDRWSDFHFEKKILGLENVGIKIREKILVWVAKQVSYEEIFEKVPRTVCELLPNVDFSESWRISQLCIIFVLSIIAASYQLIKNGFQLKDILSRGNSFQSISRCLHEQSSSCVQGTKSCLVGCRRSFKKTTVLLNELSDSIRWEFDTVSNWLRGGQDGAQNEHQDEPPGPVLFDAGPPNANPFLLPGIPVWEDETVINIAENLHLPLQVQDNPFNTLDGPPNIEIPPMGVVIAPPH